MAGQSKRFKIAGYKQPKYTIMVHGKTLFEWSMLSLAAFNDSRYIFIVQKKDNSNTFIYDKCKKLKIKNYVIKEIDFDTDGQATTATLVKDIVSNMEPIIIYNIDTFVIPNVIQPSNIIGDGFIPCSSMTGNNWSFVEIDKNGNAVKVTEKERISSNCSIGLYYFNSYKLFLELVDEYYSVENNIKEKYIAPIYNLLIKKNKSVRIMSIDSKNVFVLGTPEEVEQFSKNGDFDEKKYNI